MASSGWIADRAKDIMSTELNIGPKAHQDRLEKKYNVTLRFGITWKGVHAILFSILTHISSYICNSSAKQPRRASFLILIKFHS